MKNQSEIKLTLPYPPSVNHLFASFNGRRILSKRGRDYKAEVLALCFANKIQPLKGNIKVEYRAFRPRKTGDLDNLNKSILDSLKGSAFFDDKQIIEIHAFRFEDAKNPRVEIEILET